MRAGGEKVEGILLDGFIFLYKKGELGNRTVRGKGLEKPPGERERIQGQMEQFWVVVRAQETVEAMMRGFHPCRTSGRK